MDVQVSMLAVQTQQTLLCRQLLSAVAEPGSVACRWTRTCSATLEPSPWTTSPTSRALLTRRSLCAPSAAVDCSTLQDSWSPDMLPLRHAACPGGGSWLACRRRRCLLAGPQASERAPRMAPVQGNDVGNRLAYLLSTGNLQSRSGLDMSQSTGFTIVAERLNFVRCGMPLQTMHPPPAAAADAQI